MIRLWRHLNIYLFERPRFTYGYSDTSKPRTIPDFAHHKRKSAQDVLDGEITIILFSVSFENGQRHVVEYVHY
jgi:hypothetical protein